MNQPLVSIGIPAFKGVHFAEALRSIKNQTYRNIEVIVQDDASPDDLESIFDAEVGDDSRFSYARNETNTAPYFVKNWQKTVEKARGEFFVLAGDDDVYEPEYVEELVCISEDYHNVDLFFSWHDCFNSNDGVVLLPYKVPEFQSQIEFLYSSLVMGRWYQAQIGMARLAALRKVGGFVDLPAAWPSDLVTWTILSKNGVVTKSRILAHWRIDGNNISSSNNEKWSLLKIESALLIRHRWMDWVGGIPVKNQDEEFQKKEILRKLNSGYLPWLVYSEFKRLSFWGLCSVLKRLVSDGEITKLRACRFALSKLKHKFFLIGIVL